MRHAHTLVVSALLAVLITGCAGAPTAQPPSAAQTETVPSKTLVVLVRAEPPSLNPKPFRSLGLTADLSGRMFNAGLTIRNDAGLPVPYLAAAVPQLNSSLGAAAPRPPEEGGTWTVFPDGTMVTTYRLKPNTTWQDSQPLTADDFVFSFEVYSNPAFGHAASPPINLIDRVAAPDSRTVSISWKRTFPDADALVAGGGGNSNTALPPLPRHLLGELFGSLDPEAFMASSFWTQGYIGAGPYRLDRWEVGSFLEGVAFDGDVMGKPKIPRIREVIIADPNTVVANLMAGEGALTSGDSIRFTDGEVLRHQWADRGRILNFPNLYRITQFQRKPDYASTLAFTDLRVRQALHHSVDFDTINEALQAGRTARATGPIPPTAAYYSELDQAVAHYPYEPRKTEQLMTDAGFAKAPDGIWVSPNPAFGRMSFETNVLASPDSDNEMSIMADTWRKAGFDVRQVHWTPALGADTRVRATFPGLSTTSTGQGEPALADYRSDRVPTPEGRWRGSNRGSWPGSPEYDRMVDIFETSLDRNERTRAIIGMNKMLTEDTVVINLYWKLNAQAVAHGLTGPRLTDPTGTPEWNIQEWSYR